ncbi:hypothetical protein [Streptomyces sp. NRRL S-350]|uniref:hypothetical protein n=1 Tax=Streptomyces sp. NRRL S-350 TaxID=1463902 RepID=UPI0004C1BC30|nr:hypothetical protein [Streptomyces sp. NRRL S-350]
MNLAVTPGQLSIGGLAVSLGTLLFVSIRTVLRWRREGFHPPDWASLLVFTSGLLMGLVSALCAGGLLALAAHNVAKATNKVGNTVTGHGSEHLLAPAQPAGLQAGGGFAVFLLLLVLVVLWRCSDSALRRRIALGGVIGSSLGLAGGVVGAASVTVIPWLNAIGAPYLQS